jgi:YkoY family integral membrane protein
MGASLWAEYGGVLLTLIALEGILAADNALVLAIIVKHLPRRERKKALFYGLAGAFVLRFGSLFAISFLVKAWQLQAIGAVYLFFIFLNHFFQKSAGNRDSIRVKRQNRQTKKQNKGGLGLWLTVVKVELADIAFAVDSILAAVALAISLPKTNLPSIGGLDGGQFLTIFAGGFIGLIIMRFAASFFVNLLHRRPGLETAAFLIVGWVGVKLSVHTLSHPSISVLPAGLGEAPEWKAVFYVGLLLIALGGWFLSKKEKGAN